MPTREEIALAACDAFRPADVQADDRPFEAWLAVADAILALPSPAPVGEVLTSEERVLVEQHREYQAISNEVWRREGKPTHHGPTLLQIVDRLAPPPVQQTAAAEAREEGR